MGIEKNVVWSELVRQLIKDYMSVEEKSMPEIDELEKEIEKSRKMIKEQEKKLQAATVQLSIKRIRQKEEYDLMMKEMPAYGQSLKEAGVLESDL